MNMKKLMVYSKEELILYILKNCFSRDIENDMKHIHVQNLLDKDMILSEKAHSEEIKLLNKISNMQENTFELKLEKMKAYDKYYKLCKKNEIAFEKRQKEINKYF